jgi:hypothetical protein
MCFAMEYIGYRSQTRDVRFPQSKQLRRSTANSSVSVSSKPQTEADRGCSVYLISRGQNNRTAQLLHTLVRHAHSAVILPVCLVKVTPLLIT